MDGSMMDARAMREKEKASHEAAAIQRVGEDRRRPVLEQIEALTESITYLDDMLYTLTERLGPALTPELDVKSDGGSNMVAPARSTSTLADAIEEQANRIRRDIGKIQNLNERIEL